MKGALEFLMPMINWTGVVCPCPCPCPCPCLWPYPEGWLGNIIHLFFFSLSRVFGWRRLRLHLDNGDKGEAERDHIVEQQAQVAVTERPTWGREADDVLEGSHITPFLLSLSLSSGNRDYLYVERYRNSRRLYSR